VPQGQGEPGQAAGGAGAGAGAGAGKAYWSFLFSIFHFPFDPSTPRRFFVETF
jgi:hypothetical protein